ncbi:GDP-mannose 4,6-dehydratase [Candidatus Woesearchaeota archaeon]|nr:GDP-mannose 4,6-dehydratase [Candidatus Woesearchaeota archaeon]
MKTALLTGITGQDGSYLAEFLLNKGYRVCGIVRRVSLPNISRIEHIMDKLELFGADLTDQASLTSVVQKVRPDEVYNLGSQSFVKTSWEQPALTADVTGVGVTKILEAIHSVDPKIKFYQASSSEMFGKVIEIPQNEKTPFYPRSPYAVAKVYAHWITVNYRESYDMFTTSGMCFNHESPRRGLEFVTRKITDGVARIKLGLAKDLVLGNLDAKRDWGFAGDFVEAMWLMLQQEKPSDYVIATGETHSIKEFLEESFKIAGIDDWQKYVKQDARFMRPAEVDHLIGDYSKAKKELGWEPKVKFKELVRMMVEADIDKFNKNKY